MKPLLILAALALAGCGINPVEGDFGVVAVVPERKTCWTKVKHPGGRINYEPRPCEGEGHDLEIMGRRW